MQTAGSKAPKRENLRVIMTPLGSAASNVFYLLNLMFFLVYCTEVLGLNVTVVGFVMTAMRLFDGITDPLIASVIDRTETRFGKFRPFLMIGSVVMIVASLAIYMLSMNIPQAFRLVWVILWYAIWVLGYTCMTTVNKSVLAIVTKNPKKRPLSGIAGGIYSTVVGALVTILIVPMLNRYGGMASAKGWAVVISGAVVLHFILLLGALYAISAADKPENYAGISTSSTEKGVFRKSFSLLRQNQPLRMLLIATSTDKLAATMQSAGTAFFYIYAVQNLDLQPIISGLSTPISLLGAFVAGFVAVKIGCKQASLFGSFANFILEAILIIFRPFGDSTLLIFIVLMSANAMFRRFSAQNVDPLIAEIIDYHQMKTGEFMPALIGASFTLLDKIISSFGSSLVGIMMGIAGYAAGAEPTHALYVMTIAIFLGAPLLGDLASILSMRRYGITKEDYRRMYELKSERESKVEA